MRIASLIARYLLGIVFLVFGANGFLHFIPMQPMSGNAAQFMGALVASKMVVVISLLEFVSALLLLVGRYVPLALVLLGPVIVNIVLFHAFMAPTGLPIAAVTALLWLLTAYSVRSSLRGIFDARPVAS